MLKRLLEGFFEVLEVGMMEALITPSVPWLFIPSWLFMILGLIIQLRCLKKRKAGWFMAILGIALLFSEIFCQIITGWDVLIFLVVYGLLLDMLIGAALGTVLHFLRKRKT